MSYAFLLIIESLLTLSISITKIFILIILENNKGFSRPGFIGMYFQRHLRR